MNFKELEAYAAKLSEENESLKAANAKLSEENAASAREIAKLRSDLAASEAQAAASIVASEVYVLITGLMHDKKILRAGDRLPFDPTNPPKGSEGLIEGQHYRKERVLSHAR